MLVQFVLKVCIKLVVSTRIEMICVYRDIFYVHVYVPTYLTISSSVCSLTVYIYLTRTNKILLSVGDRTTIFLIIFISSSRLTSGRYT